MLVLSIEHVRDNIQTLNGTAMRQHGNSSEEIENIHDKNKFK
jgi:hypothetical protein